MLLPPRLQNKVRVWIPPRRLTPTVTEVLTFMPHCPYSLKVSIVLLRITKEENPTPFHSHSGINICVIFSMIPFLGS
jgi:hypothetical protein